MMMTSLMYVGQFTSQASLIVVSEKSAGATGAAT